MGRWGLDSSGSGWGPVAGSYGHCNETFVSIKGGQFLDLTDSKLLKKDSVPWS